MHNASFVAELAKLRSSAMFLSLMGYKNAHDELANYSIVFHISYANALEKSIKILNNHSVTSELESVAKSELLHGYQQSLGRISSTEIEDIDDAYTRYFDESGNYIKGVKLHTDTGNLHLYGLVVHKKVLSSGTYPKRNKRPLTIAKDNLRDLLPVNKFRQFIINSNSVDHISVENILLLPNNF